MKLAMLALLIPAFLMTEMSFAKDGRLRCRASGLGGREADLRFEEGRLRAKWEIDLGQGQEAGQLVKVTIAGQFVENIVLNEVEGDQLEGKFEIRNGFPSIKAGTKVVIGSLKCSFIKD